MGEAYKWVCEEKLGDYIDGLEKTTIVLNKGDVE